MYNPLDELGSEVERVFTFENGDYLYVDYDEKNNILFAGHATNAGVMKEVKIQYDKDDTLYENLERLREACIEDDPSRLEEKTTDSKEAKKGVVVNVGKKDGLKKRKDGASYYVYQFPPFTEEDKESAKDYNLTILGYSSDGDTYVRGALRDIKAFAGESLGYVLVDGYLWKERDFDGVVFEDSKCAKKDNLRRKAKDENHKLSAEEVAMTKAIYVRTPEDKEVWNSLTEEEKWLLRMSADQGFWWDLEDKDKERVYRLESRFSSFKGLSDSKTKKAKRKTKDEIIAGIDDWVIKEVIDKVRDIDDKGGVVEYKRMMDFIKSLSEDLSEFDCHRIYNYIRNKYDSGKIWDDGKKTRDDDFSFGYELIDVEYYPYTLKQTGNKTQGTLDKSIIGICTLYGIETRRGEKYNDYDLAKFIWYVPENEVRIYVSNKRTKPYSNTDLKEAEKILLDKLVKNVDANRYFKDSRPQGKRFKLKTSKHDSAKFIVRRLRRK